MRAARQYKSLLLLAGLNLNGTVVIPMSFDAPSRDIPPDVLVTALASRLADLQSARIDTDANVISAPGTQGGVAGRRALVAGNLLNALEQRLVAGDSGFAPLSVIADNLKDIIHDLEIGELRFCARFLDVDRDINFKLPVDGKFIDHKATDWTRLLRYQARLDRVKLTEAGRIWIRVLRNREQWLFEDKEVEKIISALHGGLFEQIPSIATAVVTSIRLFNEHLTIILESPSFRELLSQYLQRRAHFSEMIERCHVAAISALERVGSKETAAKHEEWAGIVGERAVAIATIRGHIDRVHRATESLRRSWAELLDLVQQDKRPRVGLIRFDLVLDEFVENPATEAASQALLDAIGGWGTDADFYSILDNIGCLPEAVEPDTDVGVEFEIVVNAAKANFQSWLQLHRAVILDALNTGPKSLFDFVDLPSVGISHPNDISGLFGVYIVSKPFGKALRIEVAHRSGLRSIDRFGYRVTASDLVLRIVSEGE